MADEFIAASIDILQRAERPLVRLALGALIDERALNTREGQLVAVVLEQILPQFRPHCLEQIARVADHGVVAQHGVPRLDQIVQAEQAEGEEDRQQQPIMTGRQNQRKRDGSENPAEAEDDIAVQEGGEDEPVIPHCSPLLPQRTALRPASIQLVSANRR